MLTGRRPIGAVIVLALCLAAPAPGRAAVEGEACESEPTDQPIRYGDLIDCALDQIGDSDTFRFSGGSGETVKVQVSRLAGGFACFQLFDPSGASLDLIRCSNTTRDYLLSQTGTHSIVILESDLDETAQYALALDRVDPPSPAALPIDYNEVRSTTSSTASATPISSSSRARRARP